MVSQDLSAFDYFFFDLDGCLFENDIPLPGAIPFIHHLQALHKAIYFITNNSQRSRITLTEFLAQNSIQAKLENILCGSYACALWIQQNQAAGSKILTIGEEGVDQELSEMGFQVINAKSIEDPNADYFTIEIDDNIKVVAVSHCESLTYHNLCYSSMCIQSGATLISPNYDAYWKSGKYKMPCSACIVDALLAASNTQTFVNVGKPNPYLLETIVTRDGLDKSKIIIFGDTMKTDILLAKNSNVKSALVLTGVETAETYRTYQYAPDLVFESLENL